MGRYVTCEWKAAHLVRAGMAGLPLYGWPPVGVSVLVKKLSFLGLIVFLFFFITFPTSVYYDAISVDHEYKRD